MPRLNTCRGSPTSNSQKTMVAGTLKTGYSHNSSISTITGMSAARFAAVDVLLASGARFGAA